MFPDLACTVEARDIFVLTPTPGTCIRQWYQFFVSTELMPHIIYEALTILGDATAVTQAVAVEGPIPVVLLYVRHLCLPVICQQFIRFIPYCCNCFFQLTGKARWCSVKSRTHSTLFNPNPLMLSKYSLYVWNQFLLWIHCLHEIGLFTCVSLLLVNELREFRMLVSPMRVKKCSHYCL